MQHVTKGQRPPAISDIDDGQKAGFMFVVVAALALWALIGAALLMIF